MTPSKLAVSLLVVATFVAFIDSSAAVSTYEPFDVDVGLGESIDGLTGESSYGFEADSSWAVGACSAVLTEGLDYTDSTGNVLFTQGRAMQVSSIQQHTVIQRALETILSVSAGDYWISFLVRLDTAGQPGDAFWSPDGVWDYSAAGMQQSSALRFVNAATSRVNVVQGETYFVVVRVGATSEMWVNPNLLSPGPSLATDTRPPRSDAINAIFKFNQVNNGGYTFDEFRVGSSFADLVSQPTPPTPAPTPTLPPTAPPTATPLPPTPAPLKSDCEPCFSNDECNSGKCRQKLCGSRKAQRNGGCRAKKIRFTKEVCEPCQRAAECQARRCINKMCGNRRAQRAARC